MTDTRDRAAGRSNPASRAAEPGLDGAAASRGFTPNARRRNRIAAGVLLGALAIGGNALVYSSLDTKEPVVQAVVDIPAGTQITADLLGTVDVDADPTVNLVDGDDLATLVGQYAKVRLVAGSIVTADSFQSRPLVALGSAVVAVQVPEGTLPIGVRERVPVQLVIATQRGSVEPGTPIAIDGRVVGLPTATDSALGVESVSVEVAAADAPTLAAADDVRVVLLDPASDQAVEEPPDDDPIVGDTEEPGGS